MEDWIQKRRTKNRTVDSRPWHCEARYLARTELVDCLWALLGGELTES